MLLQIGAVPCERRCWDVDVLSVAFCPTIVTGVWLLTPFPLAFGNLCVLGEH